MKGVIYLLKIKILLIHSINKPYLQPRLLPEILTISNLRHAASRTSTCAEPELRLCWRGYAVVKTTTPWRLITAFSVSLNVTQFVNCENELTRCLVCVIANIFFLYTEDWDIFKFYIWTVKLTLTSAISFPYQRKNNNSVGVTSRI